MWLLVATLSLAFIIPSCGAKLIYIDIHVIQIKCLFCMYVCAHVAYFSVVQQTSQGSAVTCFNVECCNKKQKTVAWATPKL